MPSRRIALVATAVVGATAALIVLATGHLGSGRWAGTAARNLPDSVGNAGNGSGAAAGIASPGTSGGSQQGSSGGGGSAGGSSGSGGESHPLTGPIPTLMPTPAGYLPSPDPRSPACRATPASPFCGARSLRYLVDGDSLSVYQRWLPVLHAGRATVNDDGCATFSPAAAQFCAVDTTYKGQRTLVTFKPNLDGPYSPSAVGAQIAAIAARAGVAAAKAPTPAAAAEIQKDAVAAENKIKAAAARFHREHPRTTAYVLIAGH